jgi:hypothetical protein
MNGQAVSMGAQLKIGDHVLYVRGKPGEAATPQHALIHIIFSPVSEHPYLTLVTVQPGERGICYRSNIPHRTRWKDEKGYYVLPMELWP